MFKLPLLFLLLLPLTHTANILVTCGTFGSHLYVSAEVADLLVDAGHNVTLLGLFNEPRVDMSKRKFHWAAVRNNTVAEIEDLHEMLGGIMDRPSEDMMVDMMFGTEKAVYRMNDWMKIALSYYSGEAFSRLMEDGKFDLVVAEDTAVIGVAVSLIDAGIPVISLTCTSDVKDTRDYKEGLPGLLTSEPSYWIYMQADSPPTFHQRWETMFRLGRMVQFAITTMIPHFVEPMATTGHRFEDFNGIADVIFVLDHSAISFPYLKPSNVFYLGFFHLENRPVNSLPGHLENFIANCPYDDVAFMSFGSYFSDISILKQTETILRTISNTKICLILKTGEDVAHLYNLPPNRVLQQSWIPQKDLLGSGKVSFFISHCGNNGRLESIYYNVPLICIPLFGDQYHNANLVRRNQHGLLLLKEHLTEETFRDALQNMRDNREVFAGNMRRAAETVKRDPSSGAEVLLFHAEYLLKHGNADYLRNWVIKEQTTMEIYNVDIFLLFLVSVIGVMFCLYKVAKFALRRVRKSKQE